MTEKEISKLVHAELKRLSEAGRIIFQRNNAGHVPSAGVRVHLAPAGVRGLHSLRPRRTNTAHRVEERQRTNERQPTRTLRQADVAWTRLLDMQLSGERPEGVVQYWCRPERDVERTRARWCDSLEAQAILRRRIQPHLAIRSCMAAGICSSGVVGIRMGGSASPG